MKIFRRVVDQLVCIEGAVAAVDDGGRDEVGGRVGGGGEEGGADGGAHVVGGEVEEADFAHFG